MSFKFPMANELTRALDSYDDNKTQMALALMSGKM